MIHELGHALGLGDSSDPSSPMYETLATGVADRTVSTQDLNIPDPPEGADPQLAAGFQRVAAIGSSPTGVQSPTGAEPVHGAVGLIPLVVRDFTHMPVSTVRLLAPQSALPERLSAPLVQHQLTGKAVMRRFLTAQKPDGGTPGRVNPLSDQTPESVLDDLAAAAIPSRVRTGAGAIVTFPATMIGDAHTEQSEEQLGYHPVTSIPPRPMLQQEPTAQGAASKAGLTDMLLAAGFCSFGAGALAARRRQLTSSLPKR